MDPNGKNLRYLTTGMDPALSPDGKQVAFTRWDGQDNGVSGSLWVINVDGTGERQVHAGANQPKSPTWSADGKQIVISMQQGGTIAGPDNQPTLPAVRRAGMTCRLAPRSLVTRCACSFRPTRTGACAWSTLPMAPSKTCQRDAHSFAPTWDPANTWHVVFRGDKGLENLDLNRDVTWTLASNGSYRGPVFSPDGSKIAVTFKQNDHWEVHVMNADGTGEVRLTETPMSVIRRRVCWPGRQPTRGTTPRRPGRRTASRSPSSAIGTARTRSG